MFNPLAKYKYINKVFREHPLAQHNLKKSWGNYLLYNVIIRIKNTPTKFKWVNGLSIYIQTIYPSKFHWCIFDPNHHIV